MRPVLASLAATTLLVIATAASAAPDPTPVPADAATATKSDSEPAQVAIGVNFPAMWKHSVGVSVAVGFARHHAIRANVARYENTGEMGTLIGDVFFDGDGSDAIKSGYNVDVGLSYMAFSNKLWDGLFIEAGVLVRDHEKKVMDDYASMAVVNTDTMLFGGRGHVGYSWLVYGRMFVQAAVGASVGYEVGSESTARSIDDMPESHDVARSTKSAEGFLRFGGAFDL